MQIQGAPEIYCEKQHPSLCVRDVLSAADFYVGKLGFKLGFTWGDPPTFAGVNFGSVQTFLQQGTPNPEGCSVFFVVENADELYAFHEANGVAILAPPEDRPWGLRDYTVEDLHGYRLTFGHHLYNQGPPLEIKRVDVPVRLEVRLAAVLSDLAKFKRMSLSSCLEETLLHTFEGVGPHTKTDLRRIQLLKEKHRVDYDSHASYRFVEC